MIEATGDRGEVILYRTEDGRTALDVRLAGETVWLTQAQMVDLFGRKRSVITKHIRNLFVEGELKERGNVQKMHIANSDKPVALYSLDVIISVGYRIKSKRGTQFRIWATRAAIDTLKARFLERNEATRLFYFVIKDHPFSDGNKRIGSFLFILFQRENGYLEDESVHVNINDNALVALALLIAESEPRNKELMIRLVMNLVVEGVG